MKQSQETKGASQEAIVEELESAIKKFTDKLGGFVYPLIIFPLETINEDILFEIYSDLRKFGPQKKLTILLYSYGGDAHTAFHIGRLLQKYAKEELSIYVLREAKSAATLISCSANEIVFSEISELGPMDPQISRSTSDDKFSPLAIKHALDLLQKESEAEHKQIVDTLSDRLPDPLILGEHLKSLETGKEYLTKLLSSRMFKGHSEEKIKSIAEQLVTGYPDHLYCIDFLEAKDIGLKVRKAGEDLYEILLKVMKDYKTIWDRFDQHIKDSRKSDGKHDEDEFKHAVGLYSSMKKLATKIIDYQIQDNDSKTKKSASNSTPKKKTTK